MKIIYSICIVLILLSFTSCEPDCEPIGHPPMYVYYVDRNTGKELFSPSTIYDEFFIIEANSLDTFYYYTINHQNRFVATIDFIEAVSSFGADDTVTLYANFKNQYDTIDINFLVRYSDKCLPDYEKMDFYVNKRSVSAHNNIVQIVR